MYCQTTNKHNVCCICITPPMRAAIFGFKTWLDSLSCSFAYRFHIHCQPTSFLLIFSAQLHRQVKVPFLLRERVSCFQAGLRGSKTVAVGMFSSRGSCDRSCLRAVLSAIKYRQHQQVISRKPWTPPWGAPVQGRRKHPVLAALTGACELPWPPFSLPSRQ